MTLRVGVSLSSFQLKAWSKKSLNLVHVKQSWKILNMKNIIF